ncbi:hypothetical protein BDV93DRAFT_335187 [Ceratobasidium sp. AG-I]|nr:hypothetical protein BDV93DRAFT_335187 [Ceratobasidium sp. AG-I]
MIGVPEGRGRAGERCWILWGREDWTTAPEHEPRRARATREVVAKEKRKWRRIKLVLSRLEATPMYTSLIHSLAVIALYCLLSELQVSRTIERGTHFVGTLQLERWDGWSHSRAGCTDEQETYIIRQTSFPRGHSYAGTVVTSLFWCTVSST